jgi:hypothetical protein
MAKLSTHHSFAISTINRIHVDSGTKATFKRGNRYDQKDDNHLDDAGICF